jgi:hypothetical protein
MSEVKEKFKVYDLYYNEDIYFDDYDLAFEYCLEREIIYYSNAVQYLLDHDTSFNESLILAHDLGFEVENLNSEVLATLHYQDQLINSIEEVI